MQPQPPNPEHKRMKREKKTIGCMTEIYCKKHHGTSGGELCPECLEFREYAFLRLDKCAASCFNDADAFAGFAGFVTDVGACDFRVFS